MKINIINFDNDNCIAAYNAEVLSLFLKKSGEDVSVFCESGSYLFAQAEKLKIPVYPLSLALKIGLKSLPAADINDYFGYSFFIKTMLLKNNKHNRKSFLRIYDFYPQKILSSVKEISKYFYRILPACESLKDELISAGITRDKTFVFYPILNMTRWESAKLIKTAMFLKRPFKIGMSYREINEENLLFFLRIAKKTIEEVSNADFIMVGPRYEKIREKAREMGISHRLDMLDWRTDMPEVMAMLHVFIKTEINPKISRSLMEAMASGVVCAVPRIKGLSDFIIHDFNGVLTEPGNVTDYVMAIKKFLGNPPLCQTMSLAAFNHINDNMSAQVLSKLSKVLYEEPVQ
ncbi:MAG: glycosyltransferase family 4 protein [Elusimicrobia bacterium]|nr:glycosyltransferase family 4 protein [Elusimicrobiota bacterium]